MFISFDLLTGDAVVFGLYVIWLEQLGSGVDSRAASGSFPICARVIETAASLAFSHLFLLPK